MSRVVGHIHAVPVPKPARPLVYTVWGKLVGANMHEIKDPLDSMRSLQDFFTRDVKPGVHVINDHPGALTSPCDGTVTSLSASAAGRTPMVHQVKGIQYPIAELLGLHHAPAPKPGNALHCAVMYLSPSDYHRFHSPTDWTVSTRRHIAGQLLPVNKLAVKMLPSLYAVNERVVLTGEWVHGLFAYVAVGATNVGSIELLWDAELKTNRMTIPRPIGKGLAGLGWGLKALARPFSMRRKSSGTPPSSVPPTPAAASPSPSASSPSSASSSPSIHDEVTYPQPVELSRGELMGRFKLGSTIVMVFEAPEDFEFAVKAKDRVRVGDAVGHWAVPDLPTSPVPTLSSVVVPPIATVPPPANSTPFVDANSTPACSLSSNSGESTSLWSDVSDPLAAPGLMVSPIHASAAT